VFSSEDVEELRSKVDAGTPASLGATLETLYKMGCIERQKVRARYFYGSSEAISRLRTRMTETASERAQREARQAVSPSTLAPEIRGVLLADRTPRG